MRALSSQGSKQIICGSPPPEEFCHPSTRSQAAQPSVKGVKSPDLQPYMSLLLELLDLQTAAGGHLRKQLQSRVH